MKKLFLISLFLLIGCAHVDKKVMEWEQAYVDGKITYFELEQLKNQKEIARRSGVAPFIYNAK